MEVFLAWFLCLALGSSNNVDDARYLVGYRAVESITGGREIVQIKLPVPEVSRSWERLLTQAETLQDDGHYHQALDIYRQMIGNQRIERQLGISGGYRHRIGLGKVLLKMRVLGHAALMFEEASVLRTDSHMAHFWLGLTRSKQGEIDKAIVHYKNALFFVPEYLDALHNLGSLLLIKGHINEGMHYYRTALRLRNTGDNATDANENSAEDADVSDNQLYYHFIQHVFGCFSLQPKHHNNQLYRTISRFLELPAESQFNGRMLFDFGRTLQTLGLMKEGESLMRFGWERAQTERYPFLSTMRVTLAMQLPAVSVSSADHNAAWRQLRAALSGLLQEVRPQEQQQNDEDSAWGMTSLSHEDDDEADEEESAPRTIEEQALLLHESEAYDTVPLLLANQRLWQAQSELRDGMTGASDSVRAVMHDAAQLYLRITPSLQHVSQAAAVAEARMHAIPAQYNGRRKIRVGFVSGLFRQHSVGQITMGLVRGLPRSRFQVALLQLPTHVDRFSQRLAHSADVALAIPVNLTRAREKVEALQLDVLLVPDTLDPLVYFLAFSRLAPVQAAYWVGGSTCALPWSIDYYVTSTLFGADEVEAARNFEEQIVQFDGLGAALELKDKPVGPPVQEFDGHYFFSDKRLYMVVSSLRVHPDFDEVLGNLLNADPRAEIAIVNDDDDLHQQDIFMAKLHQRFEQRVGGASKRVRLFPGTNSTMRLELMRIADVVLDTFPSSNAMAVLDAFSLAKPVITLPSKQMPGTRYAAGMYRAMNLSAHVSSSIEGYVQRAILLANNTKLREQTMRTIANSRAVLNEHKTAMRDWVVFLEKVTRRHRFVLGR